MPLTDFVRYLNAQLPLTSSALRSSSPFVSEGGNVFVYFANLRLDSGFSAIVDTANGELNGHVAFLNATQIGNGHPLNTEAVFAVPNNDEELIFLDRLVRTLHTLNYLTYRERHFRELLLLKVHPRHVASVATDHGLAFEEILRACGLLPGQITLELKIGGVESLTHLLRAIDNYKSRGYSIAIDAVGLRELDDKLLQTISPSCIRLDSQYFDLEHHQRPSLDSLRNLGVKLLVEGVNTEFSRKNACKNGIDFLQVGSSARRLLHASPELLVAA